MMMIEVSDVYGDDDDGDADDDYDADDDEEDRCPSLLVRLVRRCLRCRCPLLMRMMTMTMMMMSVTMSPGCLLQHRVSSVWVWDICKYIYILSGGASALSTAAAALLSAAQSACALKPTVGWNASSIGFCCVCCVLVRMRVCARVHTRARARVCAHVLNVVHDLRVHVCVFLWRMMTNYVRYLYIYI